MSKQEELCHQPITTLLGVGKQTAKHLARLTIHTVYDLLFHFPLRYQDRTQRTPIAKLVVGEEALVSGVITHVDIPFRGRTKLYCELKDETGKLHLRFFHVLSFQLKQLKVGEKIRCYGLVKWGVEGREMVHPEYQVMYPHQSLPEETHLTPIYPLTEGIHQSLMRKLTGEALKRLQGQAIMRETLPPVLCESLSLPTRAEALFFIHRPPPAIAQQDLQCYRTKAHQRFIIEELVAHRLGLLHTKSLIQSQRAPQLIQISSLITQLLQHLPFQLTNAQQRVLSEIQTDLKKNHPMLRLLQGDVGSGKTIVAALAMLQAVENGYQSVLMAPTELLAEQHYRVLSKWLEPLNVDVVFLSGKIKFQAREQALSAIQNGVARIIIGTHAVFQEKVVFSKLGLMVIDEQHRFGVEQRALLREKSSHENYFPHQLMMTATPIPRTLAMSFYADLDVSVIDEIPSGRVPIVTRVMSNAHRHEVMARVHAACLQGKQAYWVCPLIDVSEEINCEAATQLAEKLKKAYPLLNIGLIHGRIASRQKESMMQDFRAGHIHLLVATTVIEVGVDVPNASLMIIENAERLGLSQLHQLRGRVGRGSVESHCVLMYQSPLSDLGKARLMALRETTDGFQIAERDLALRGPGEILGTKQTGQLTFRIADLMRDHYLLPIVHQFSNEIMSSHIEYIEPLTTEWLLQSTLYADV